MRTCSPTSRLSKLSVSATTAFRSVILRWTNWPRLKASNWRVSTAARSPALRISAIWLRSGSAGPNCFKTRSPYPLMTVSRLFEVVRECRPPAGRCSPVSAPGATGLPGGPFPSHPAGRSAVALSPSQSSGVTRISASRTSRPRTTSIWLTSPARHGVAETGAGQFLRAATEQFFGRRDSRSGSGRSDRRTRMPSAWGLHQGPAAGLRFWASCASRRREQSPLSRSGSSPSAAAPAGREPGGANRLPGFACTAETSPTKAAHGGRQRARTRVGVARIFSRSARSGCSSTSMICSSNRPASSLLAQASQSPARRAPSARSGRRCTTAGDSGPWRSPRGERPQPRRPQSPDRPSRSRQGRRRSPERGARSPGADRPPLHIEFTRCWYPEKGNDGAGRRRAPGARARRANREKPDRTIP